MPALVSRGSEPDSPTENWLIPLPMVRFMEFGLCMRYSNGERPYRYGRRSPISMIMFSTRVGSIVILLMKAAPAGPAPIATGTRQ